VTALDESFTKLPHSLLTRALSLGLSGCEWDVLLLLVRFAYGFQKDDCAASLTRIANKCTHSRRQIGRALQKLCRHGLIDLYQEPTYRRAGQYIILDQCDMDATVAPAPQAHECHTERGFEGASKGLRRDSMDTSATPSGIDATQSGMDATPEVTPAPLRVAPAPHIKDNRYKETLLKKPEKENGDIDMSIAFGNATSASFPKPSLRSVLSGDSVPLPDGTPLDHTDDDQTLWVVDDDGIGREAELKSEPEKTSANLRTLLQVFAEDHGEANLTKTEKREFARLIETNPWGSYLAAFYRLSLKIKGEPIPDHLRRPGDLCMMLARAAANGHGAKT
jgi:hypothetical protein